MLHFLFRRLTAEPKRGAALFEAATKLAREPHWYVEGNIPDTIDGRFAVLATVTALVLVRLERDGDAGNAAAAALTERFVEVMDSEHRELGIGDPTLGKTVRKLVGSLARRNALWRTALTVAAPDWTAATCSSLYEGSAPPAAVAHSAATLERLWGTLESTSLAEVEHGRIK